MRGSTEKLSTGLRNVRLLVRPPAGLHDSTSVARVSGPGGAAGSGRAVRSGNLGCARPQETVPSHLYIHTDDASRASRAHIWDVGGVAVLSCRARHKSHISRHINNIALWRHNPHINA